MENAPAGATATLGWTRAVKTFYDETDRNWLTRGGEWVSAEEMVERRFTLDPSPAPATARDALDLAWELAHPAPVGRIIPACTPYLYRVADDQVVVVVSAGDFFVSEEAVECRTIDPNWLDAPAVLATCPNYNGGGPAIYSPRVASDRWSCSECGEHARWQDLRDVTPLYPKETK